MMIAMFHFISKTISLPRERKYTHKSSFHLSLDRSQIIYASKLSLTHFLTLFLNAAGSSRHCLAASTFAALSSFGLLSMLMTLRRIVEGVCTGLQRSEALS